ncbi:hypothetical protein ACFO4N_07265 [Camelliibacillus cellulosilyticus]|uniref:Uncharacterized protein n=1 Tax=Camelliibacillus cellulosilyticus TaxID=2174486 RepID=A0ABV9GK51_9BACL
MVVFEIELGAKTYNDESDIRFEIESNPAQKLTTRVSMADFELKEASKRPTAVSKTETSFFLS